MKLFPEAWGLPLFRKELVEQAARKRTYVIRTIYALLLFFLFYMQFLSVWRNAQYNPLNVIGRGKNIFIMIVMMQFIGIYLFMPALMSGVLTYEKEKGTLPLLFMTHLRTGEILIEKYLSRLLPMFTFILLALPPMAIAYSMGGVSYDLMLHSSLLLFLCALQVGALALMFSSYCRTTTGSLVGCYLFMLGYLVSVIFIMNFFNFNPFGNQTSVFFHLIAPLSLQFSTMNMGTGMAIIPIHYGATCIAGSAVVCLLLAWFWLFRRSNLPPTNPLKKLYRSFDRLMHTLNRIFARGIMIQANEKLPDQHPIRWRELSRKNLHQPAHLFRNILGLEMLIVVVIMLLIPDNYNAWQRDYEEISLLVAFMWAIALLIVSIVGVNCISAERSHQTLEVLLTTPIDSHEIIRQKMSAIHRLMLVFLLPFLTVYWFEAAAEDGPYPMLYIGFSLISYVFLFKSFAWVSVWMGMVIRNRPKATLTALATLVAWIFGLFLLMPILEELSDRAIDSEFLLLFSPSSLVFMTEFPNAFQDVLNVNIIVSGLLVYLVVGGVWITFARLCHKNADRYLGRVEAEVIPGVKSTS